MVQHGLLFSFSAFKVVCRLMMMMGMVLITEQE